MHTEHEPSSGFSFGQGGSVREWGKKRRPDLTWLAGKASWSEAEVNPKCTQRFVPELISP